MIFPFLLAAALGLNPDHKNVSPGLGSRVVIRTQAFLAGSNPGEFSINAYKNIEGKNIPGDKIENVRISPAKLFLRDNVAKRVVVTIPVTNLQPGPLWICITDKPGKNPSASGSRVTLLTRSCYQRILQKRKRLLLQ